jgi:hypothetical protein
MGDDTMGVVTVKCARLHQPANMCGSSVMGGSASIVTSRGRGGGGGGGGFEGEGEGGKQQLVSCAKRQVSTDRVVSRY